MGYTLLGRDKMTKKEIISKIKKIKGVDDSKAKAIYDAGFTSVEKLKKAKIEELSKIKGINKDLAKTIVTEIGKKEAEAKKEPMKIKPVDFTPGTFPLDAARDPDLRRRAKGKKRRGWKEEARKIRKKKR